MKTAKSCLLVVGEKIAKQMAALSQWTDSRLPCIFYNRVVRLYDQTWSEQMARLTLATPKYIYEH